MREFTRRKFLGSAAAAVTLAAAGRALCADSAPLRRPNILFILADDLGWMDTGAYGSQYYQTPNIDQLARAGIRFTDAYTASPLCSPTRASIIAGKYPARLRLTTAAGHLEPEKHFVELPEKAQPWLKNREPNSLRYLPLEDVTIAEVLKAAGYATSFFGKWHLGHRNWWPDRQGFDHVVGGTEQPGPPSYWSPYRIPTIPDGNPGEYLTDRLHNEVIDYLKKRASDAPPFFMCLWEYAVHAPFGAQPHLMEKYQARKDPRGKQDSPTMASMIESMDSGIGRVLQTLNELGLEDDTIVIFFSDNGGNEYNLIDNATTPTNNDPLRSGKGNNYEGGVRVPCIVKWPGVVQPGSQCGELLSSVDWYPTLLGMAGVDHDPRQTLDGIDVGPLLRGKPIASPRAIFCDFPHSVPATGNLPNTWVRRGDYKLLRFYGDGPKGEDRLELYNLRLDISESKNLADDLPDQVAELNALISEHLKDVDAVVPQPNPAYDPQAKRPTPKPANAIDPYLKK